MTKKTVLLTGGGGRVGKHLQHVFRERYTLRNFDLQPIEGDADTIVGDINDAEALKAAMQNVDVVVHLAAQPDEAPFLEKLLPLNCAGIYNVLQAAQDCGVKRVVFASTVQTIDAYARDKPVFVSDPPCPNTRYGATKVFGEALGRYYHEKHGLEFIALRLGAFEKYEDAAKMKHPMMAAIWLSPRDAAQLFVRPVDTPDVGFCVAFGTSQTSWERLNLLEARETLGFAPQDSVAELLSGAYSPEK